MSSTILKTKDISKRIVIFHHSNYDKHKRKHPELEDSNWFPEKIKNALKNPTFTIPGYKNDTTCYYVEEFAISGIISYTKVVVMNRTDTIDSETVHHIMTAHKTNHVQEDKYPNLSRQNYVKGVPQ